MGWVGTRAPDPRGPPCVAASTGGGRQAGIPRRRHGHGHRHRHGLPRQDPREEIARIVRKDVYRIGRVGVGVRVRVRVGVVEFQLYAGVFVFAADDGGTLRVVVEFARHGNLRDFLKRNRPVGYTSAQCQQCLEQLVASTKPSCRTTALTSGDLLSFARQAARGMQFIASNKVSFTSVV